MNNLQNSNWHILIVDDVPENIKLIGMILREKNFKINIAQSGNQALNIIDRNLPDLILLDIKMPGMDGFETCRRLKKKSATKNIPVIFMSALSETVNKIQGFELGAVDYVTKPVEPEELLARIQAHLTIKSLHRELEDVNAKLEEKVRIRTEDLIKQNKLLRESENRFRRVMDSMDALVYVADMETYELLFLNKYGQKIFGDIEGGICWKTLQAGQTGPCEFCTNSRLTDNTGNPSGVYRWEHQNTIDKEWYECRDQAIWWTDERFVRLEMATNITERKQAEEELHRLRNLLSNIVNSMPSILVGVDLEGKVIQWNQEAEKATGMKARSALGRTLTEVYPQLTGEMAKVRQAIRDCEIKTEEKVAQMFNSETRFSNVTVYPLLSNGAEGAVIRIDDVTENVRMEEMIIQSEKMLSVGGLAAGMAHEINNPLAGMMQTANVIANRLGGKMDTSANVKAAEEAGTSMEAIRNFMEARGILRMLTTITESGKRLANIVNNMLSFSRKSEDQSYSHALAEIIDKTLELAATDYDLKKHYDFKLIEIKKEYEGNLPLVPCEKAKIQQVLLNILHNGAQAMQEVGTENPRFIIRMRSENKREMVRIEIEDNGPGMDEKIRKRVFEPFYTTKPAGVGTGLGLSVSYFIITKNHGGEMAVESAPGVGTKFIIRLPMEKRKA